MDRMAFLLNISMSGIKNIEKEIRIDFYGKNINKSSSFDNYNIKAIYGENGSGKTAIIIAVKIVKDFILNESYLSDSRNVELLYDLINKKTRKFYFRCEFVTNIEEFIIHEYEVSLEIDKDNEIVVTYESLKERINSVKNVQNTLFCIEKGVFTELNLPDVVKDTVIDKTKNVLEKRSAITLIMSILNNDLKSNAIPQELLYSFIFFILLYVYNDLEDSHTHYYRKSRIGQYINNKASADSQVVFSALEELYYEIYSNDRKVPIDAIKSYENRINRLEKFVKIFKPMLKGILIDKKINHDIYECRLIMDYGSYLVDREFESTGIKRIMDMFDAFVSASNYGIVFIDELDSNINGVYLNKLIEYYRDYGKGQLCFTSHNTEPMTLLKQNKKAIDFLINDNRIVSWVKNGHYTADNSYRDGMIEGLPFNVDSSDFIGIFGWEDQD